MINLMLQYTYTYEKRETIIYINRSNGFLNFVVFCIILVYELLITNFGKYYILYLLGNCY